MNTKRAVYVTPENVYYDEQIRDSVLNFLNDILADEFKRPHESSVPRRIPLLYRRTNIITLSLFLMGIACMYLDIFFSVTELGVSVYIIWCLSCISLFYTNKIALKEWKNVNGWERSEK